jgi:hypothetical protein
MSSDDRIVRDKVGYPIRPGQFIIYGHALGRSAALKFGRVLAVHSVGDHMYVRHAPRDRIRVHGVEEVIMFDGHTEYELSKPGTLQYGDRCLVLQPAVVLALPRPVYDLLKEVF